jgi:asparagine synthase (glutamine-hydrolysing)
MSSFAGIFWREACKNKNSCAVNAMTEALAYKNADTNILAPSDNLQLGYVASESHQELGAHCEGHYVFLLQGNLYKSPWSQCSSSSLNLLQELVIIPGEGLVKNIDGSFVLVAFDKNHNILSLYRDRLGTRPLYYLHKDGVFVFSSAIRPILANGYWSGGVNLKAIDQFLTYGYIPAPETPFEEIYQVQPGCRLTLKDNQLTENPYWKFEYSRNENDQLFGEQAIGAFAQAFERSMTRRLEAHPECGAFLSGGLDTSIVAAVMKKLTGERFKAFSIGFEEGAYDETGDARIVADHLGLDFYSAKIGFDADFPNLLEHLVQLHETPFSDTSAIPSYYAAKLAKEHVDTVLTGDFPDQLIGGSEHQVMAMQRQANDPWWQRSLRNQALRSVITAMPWKTTGSSFPDKVKRFLYRECFSLEEQRVLLNMPVPALMKRALYSPDLLEVNRRHDPLEITRSLYRQIPDQSLLNKILYFDIHMYAPDDLMVKVDRMTSAHGLNAVSPFHDQELVELVARLPEELKISPQGERKVIMRRAFEHLLPEQTLQKKKQGFAMPIGEWLVKNLSGYVREVLLDQKTMQRGYFNPAFMRSLVESYLAGKTDYASGSETTIISLLTLELWHRAFIDR